MLEGKLDLSAVSDLYAKLSGVTDAVTMVDMHKVTHLGALAMQVLIAAAQATRGSDRTFTLRNTSDRVLAQMAAMGMTPEMIAETR